MITCQVSSRVKSFFDAQAACRGVPSLSLKSRQGPRPLIVGGFVFIHTSRDTDNSPLANIMELDIAADVPETTKHSGEQDLEILSGKENKEKGDITNIPPCIVWWHRNPFEQRLQTVS